MNIYPKSLSIETTSICNLRCVMCPQSGKDFGRDKIHLPEKISDQLIEYIKNAESLQLHGIGEPTLSPLFWSLLKHLTKNCWSSVNTNLVNISTEKMYELVNSNLRLITISMDSPDTDTYSRIRGASLDLVIKNVKQLIQIKEECNSELVIGLNMTLMKENFLQLKQAIDLCYNINVLKLDTWPMNNWKGDFLNRNIRNWEFIYEDQSPFSFKDRYNIEIDKAIQYALTKNVKFNYRKI